MGRRFRESRLGRFRGSLEGKEGRRKGGRGESSEGRMKRERRKVAKVERFDENVHWKVRMSKRMMPMRRVVMKMRN